MLNTAFAPTRRLHIPPAFLLMKLSMPTVKSEGIETPHAGTQSKEEKTSRRCPLVGGSKASDDGRIERQSRCQNGWPEMASAVSHLHETTYGIASPSVQRPVASLSVDISHHRQGPMMPYGNMVATLPSTFPSYRCEAEAITVLGSQAELGNQIR